jgi:predicted nucleic acid-binding protein
MIVVDNTVLVDLWAGTPENQTRAEALLLQDNHWIAPGLWGYEFGNVMNKLSRLGMVSDTLKEEAISSTQKILETVHQVDLLAVDKIVSETCLKFYDASYVWLAQSRGCKLYTRDKQILRECSNVATPMP